MNVLDTVQEIKEIAKKNFNRSKSQKTRVVTDENTPIGTCFRQGDLYIFRVPKDHPVGDLVKRNQLADGVSLGARHTLNGKFTIYEGKKAPDSVSDLNARVGLGYAFDVEKTTVLGHPEHDNYVFRCTGRFQVLHQVDLRTLARAAD